MHIEVDQLVIRFASLNGGEITALGPLSLSVVPNTFVTIVGPSGSGKSTLIRVIAGLQPTTSGYVRLGNEAIDGVHPQVGIMFQDATLMPWRTVIDNIALPLEIKGIDRRTRHQAVHSLLPLLGLEGFEQAFPAELSGGMAQRVALGRLLIQKPSVLLLDEPFGALDALTRERISLDLLGLWSQDRQTALMVTHDIQEAVLLSDRVIVLSQRPGRVIADIEVPLPRPRTSEMMFMPSFIETARTVRSAIEKA